MRGMVFLLVVSVGLTGCSNADKVAKRDCKGLNGEICIELIENRSGGAATSDYTKLDIVSSEGKGRETVLTVSSPDDVTYKWDGRQLVLGVHGGLIEGFKSYWFNPKINTHHPDGDLAITLSYY